MQNSRSDSTYKLNITFNKVMQGISVQTHSDVCIPQIIKPLQSSDRDTIYLKIITLETSIYFDIYVSIS